MKTNKSISSKTGKPIYTFTYAEDEFREASDESKGHCLACGDEAWGVEPDARRYECEGCGELRVYGLEELMLMGRITIGDEPCEEEESAHV